MIAAAPQQTLHGRHSSESARVLLVSADKGTSTLISNLIHWRGYTAICARTADAALDLHAQENAIDVVIADLDLPVVGGLHLASRLRERAPQLPVMIFGERFAKEIVLALRECSNYGILRKPFIPGDFYGTLEQVLPWHKSHPFSRNAA
jgi:DNA-binding response OmpR family regulator